MKKIAEVRGGALVKVHNWPDDAVVSSHKRDTDGGPIFRPYSEGAKPAVDPATETLVGPAITVSSAGVTETWSKRALTTQEVSDRKDAAVSRLNGGVDDPLLRILLVVVNDNRALRGKVNAVIDATGQAAAVPKYAAGQVSQITMTQLKAAIRAELG